MVSWLVSCFINLVTTRYPGRPALRSWPWARSPTPLRRRACASGAAFAALRADGGRSCGLCSAPAQTDEIAAQIRAAQQRLAALCQTRMDLRQQEKRMSDEGQRVSNFMRAQLAPKLGQARRQATIRA